MRIGVIGGVDRGEELYRQLATRAGVELEFHFGGLAGRGTATLDALVERADVVVVVTNVNSHAAVWRARKQCKRSGKRLELVAHFGVSKFNALLRRLQAVPEQAVAALGARP
jgi:hypothetical protein